MLFITPEDHDEQTDAIFKKKDRIKELEKRIKKLRNTVIGQRIEMKVLDKEIECYREMSKCWEDLFKTNK